ncbi:phage tail spike protein [Bacillus anthracis]|uniref:phage tail spike protein n=1 Tax=Bacillus anthracis TaxID=1392 RepID=UPI002DBF0E53|nr:phage tail spike protein [Bacillus anthracis]MEB9506859.1 phage tail spike protein [Bacillus anthracis]
MRGPSGTLHVVDFQTNQIIAAIQPKDYWDDKRHWEIKNNIDTLEFKVFDKTKNAISLMQQNLVLKEVRDGRIVPYVITEIERDSEDRSLTAYASGEWVQLAKAGYIPPQKLEGKTVIEMIDIALAGTKWKRGNTLYSSFRSMTIDEFIDPLSLLKKIASLFDLEIQYRAEVVGHKIVSRYVDMVGKIGNDTGKEVTLGKDLIGIKRIENSQNICTALLGFVKKEGKDFITIADVNNGVPYLVDNDAFQRWNEDGMHKFGFYSPETENDDMDSKRLLTLMKTEMKKRINTSVSYEVSAHSIGRIFGLSHELINEGDVIRIKDTGFTPQLFLEARAVSGDESFTDPSKDKYIFGDYREIVDPNEELRRIYNRIISSLGNKQELIDQLDKLVKEANETASNAQKESEAAKTLAEKVQENIKNNSVEIIESQNPPTTELKDRKTLWLDISNGKPGILKLWKDGIWDPIVPDIESVKNEVSGQYNEVKESLQGFSRTITDMQNEQGTVNKKVTEIEQTASGLSSTVSNLNNILDDQGKKLTEANTKIEQQAKSIESKVEIKQVEDYVATFEIPDLKDMVENDKAELLDELANKIATEQFNTKMTQIDNRFTINEQGLDLRALKTEVYTTTESDGRYATGAYARDLEGRIQVTEKNILSTVKKGEVISSINQTAEKIKISADLIDLVGKVEASWLKAGMLLGMTIKTSNEKEYLHMENQVLKFVNQGTPKMIMGFENEYNSKTLNPYIVLGQGDGTGRNVGTIYKDGGGLYLRFIDLNGVESNIRLTAQGNIGITAQTSMWLNSKGSLVVDGEHGVSMNHAGKTVVEVQRNNSGDNDLTLGGNHMIRSSTAKGYDKLLQIKNVFGSEFRGLEVSEITAHGGIRSDTNLWAEQNSYAIEHINRSTERIKTAIHELPFSALEKILGLKVKKYYLKKDMYDLYQMRMNKPPDRTTPYTTNDIPTYYGVVAEETDDIFTTPEKDGVRQYTTLILTAASVQELYDKFVTFLEEYAKKEKEKEEENEQLKKRVVTLENEVSEMKALLQKLIS